jgi:hypothetical protein
MMYIAFGLEAFGILLPYNFGHNPVAFVVLTGVVFFAWGEIYSPCPRAAQILSAHRGFSHRAVRARGPPDPLLRILTGRFLPMQKTS